MSAKLHRRLTLPVCSNFFAAAKSPWSKAKQKALLSQSHDLQTRIVRAAVPALTPKNVLGNIFTPHRVEHFSHMFKPQFLQLNLEHRAEKLLLQIKHWVASFIIFGGEYACANFLASRSDWKEKLCAMLRNWIGNEQNQRRRRSDYKSCCLLCQL